jgi:hypothetical protein
VIHRKKKIRRKDHRRFAILIWLAVILCVAILAGILVKIIAEPYIRKKIITALNAPNSDHTIAVGEIQINWITPGIKLFKVIVATKYDSSAFSISGEIELIEFKHIHLLRALFANEFRLNQIAISKGRLLAQSLRDTTKGPIISEYAVQIGGISIYDLQIQYRSVADSQNLFVSGLTANIEQIEINPKDTLKPGLIKMVDLTLKKAGWYRSDSLYTITAHGLQYSENSGILETDSLDIVPRYKSYQHTDRFRYQTDRIECYIKNVVVHDFSLSQFVENGDFIATSILTDEIYLDAFRDKRKEFHHQPRKMLQDVIYSYAGILHIDSILIKEGRILYTEHAENAEEPGFVFFSGLQATLRNISNNPQLSAKEKLMTLNVKALLMGKAEILVDLNARLFEPNNIFTLSGTIGRMDLSILNPMFEKNQFINLSGMVKTLQFGFTADLQKATGTQSFLYNDLKVEIKNKDGLLRDKINSWIINISLVNSNPRPGEDPRIGQIDFERDPEKFIFSYSLKALMTGIKYTVTGK